MTPDTETLNWEEILDRELLAAGRAPRPSPELHRPPIDPMGRTASLSKGSSDRLHESDFEHLRQDIFDGIRQGEALPVDICDESGHVLLPAGSCINREFVHHLREIGIQRVRFRLPRTRHPADAAEIAPQTHVEERDYLQTSLSSKLDERLVGELQRPVVFRPVRAWRRPQLPITHLKERAMEALDQHAATSHAVAELCDSLAPGKRVSLDAVHRNIHQFVNMATTDFDLLPLLMSLQKSGDEYLFDHCVNTSLISIALGSHLGLDRDEITTVGLAGLLADVGMLRVPEAIRLKPGHLNDQEWLEIKRHPLHTLDMLADTRGLPPSVPFIVYQAHERMDGSGYPRGRKGDQLHRYARLVALADVYAAMTRPRPHRAAFAPYATVKEILIAGAGNKFDRQLIRALLDTVSLFPTGSVVNLCDGTKARVLRANPGMHTKPVVEQLSSDGTPTGHIIDLSKEENRRVIKAA